MSEAKTYKEWLKQEDYQDGEPAQEAWYYQQLRLARLQGNMIGFLEGMLIRVECGLDVAENLKDKIKELEEK